MAERRMFAKTIVDSDAFLEMPSSSQSLYFHLCMRADDDGFVNNPRKIQRMVGASEDDLKILLSKRFILVFDSGVIVIKHWKIHNYIRKDTYNGTLYAEEKANLFLKPDGAYTDHEVDGSSTARGRLVDGSLTQVRLGKVRLGKDSINNNRGAGGAFTPPSVEEVQAYCKERKNTIDPEAFIDFYQSKGWMVGKNKMKDWRSAMRTWERTRKANEQPNPIKQPKFEIKIIDGREVAVEIE